MSVRASLVSIVTITFASLTAVTSCCRPKPPPPAPPGPIEWIADALPGRVPDVQIKAIGGTSATDVWAVGWGIYHFDGSSWSDATPPELIGSGTALNALSVVAANDVWAAGVNGRVAHFDGKSWRSEQLDVARVSTSPSVRGYFDLLGIVAWRGEVWVTDSAARYLRFDGTTWTVVDVPSIKPRTMQRIWGLSPRDVWLPTAMLHFDGTSWNPFTLPSAGVRSVSGLAPNDIWLVGWKTPTKDNKGAAFHFDGSSYTEAPLPPDTTLLWEVSANSRDEAYAVGSYGWSVVWNGTSWRPSATGVTGTLFTVFSPAKGQAFAGGDIGSYVLRRR